MVLAIFLSWMALSIPTALILGWMIDELAGPTYAPVTVLNTAQVEAEITKIS